MVTYKLHTAINKYEHCIVDSPPVGHGAPDAMRAFTGGGGGFCLDLCLNMHMAPFRVVHEL